MSKYDTTRTLVGEINHNCWTADDALSKANVGYRYNLIKENERRLLDDMILYGTSKIPVIKYLRAELNLSLTQAKDLYEARLEWLKPAEESYNFKP